MFKFRVENYKIQILAFFLSIVAVVGSFFAGWLLIIISPLFVFLIFKLLRVWKNKERLAYGIPAIVIGILLFFFIFSYQMANVDVQKYTYGNYEITVEPYSTPNYTKPAHVEIIYNTATNASLYYQINDTKTSKMVKSGHVDGTVSGNKTYYSFNVTMPKGIYYMKFKVGNNTTYGGEIIREQPDGLFSYFLFMSGGYLIGLLSILYTLLIFGVHAIRKTQEIAKLRNERRN